VVKRLLLAACCVLLAAGSQKCARRALGPSERPVRIFVTDARIDRLPLYAAAVKARQAVSSTIWLVTGDPLADNSLRTLSDGAAQSALLSRSGVDAVVLTPGWLSFGLPRLNEMIAKGRYYSLSASLLDAAGQTIGHPFMVKKSGSAILAVTGLALDSANVLTHLARVGYVAPGLAAGKAITLMRQRADLVGVMVEPRSTGSDWHADFTVNVSASGEFAMTRSADTDRINCYDVSADAGRLTARTVDLGQFKPDTAVVRLLDSVRTVADSLAARIIPLPRAPFDAESLGGAFIQGVLASRLADGFLCDSLYVADFKQPKNVGTLVGLLRDPGRLAILSVQGDMLSGWPKQLVLRPGLSRSELSRGLTYRVATTIDYLERHPDMATSGFELSSRPFWTICLDILQSGRVK
jgi:hypothetical protein